MYINKLKEMFLQMVVKKDASLIPLYYHKDFLLYANEEKMDYAQFLRDHEEYYKTAIQYHVEYDEETFFEKEEKVAGRMWITVSRPNELAKKLEVVLIVQFKDDKIYRIWELTYPDWSKLPMFEKSV